VAACYGEQAVNSLRPIATISLLGIVGLFLYMKINETEPVIPADAMSWDMTGDLDIGNVDIGGSDFGSLEIGAQSGAIDAPVSTAPAAATSAPSYSEAPSFDSAPAYTSNATTSAAPPAFVPETIPAEPNIETETLAAEIEPSESSKLPPLPALPALVTGAAGVAQEASTDIAPAYNSEVGNPSLAAPVTSQDSLTSQTSAAPSFTTEDPITPTESLQAESNTSAGQASLFSATRLAVQSALDRGELSQALLLLSDWYGDPSLSAEEATEVEELLSQLAGSVIYSTEHRLEPPYMVQAGERLEDIAQKHNIPWQLLAKINGLASPDQLQPGQQLKVVRGPFSARIDLSEHKLVLMLDRRYAGQFTVDVEPTSSIEEGYWAVNQKLLTPGNVGMLNAAAAPPGEERSILLTSTNGGTGQVTILRGPGPATSASIETAGRVIQLRSTDVSDVYDILSLGSQVMIRR
jgi:LysM repeat protein